MTDTKQIQWYFCRFFFFLVFYCFLRALKKILLVFCLYVMISSFVFLWVLFFFVCVCLSVLCELVLMCTHVYSGLIFLSACLLPEEREKEGVVLDGWGRIYQEIEETVFRIYCMKIFIFNKNGTHKDSSSLQKCFF